ncbi:hypothetical protein [Lelliottia wanjuensis]|uniref:hypothetical protein n=1 Tax=Lelliottia wanjuensis TaxID=3050585 RepID=UPI002551770D|nr:hypothetical protein [Lelliottia sp. V106_16]MDK9356712.1 hypothetical protein [Lelliottia sp. V106_16]
MAKINNPLGGSYVHVDFEGDTRIDFDRRKVRKAFAQIGQAIQQDARDRVSSRRGSLPGQDPGWESGKLYKSIGYFVPSMTKNRPGFMVKISPNQRKGKAMTPFATGEEYYPADLFYGVRRGARRVYDEHGKRSHKKGAAGGSGWRIAPRANFMTEALKSKKYWTEKILFNALRSAVKPGGGKR